MDALSAFMGGKPMKEEKKHRRGRTRTKSADDADAEAPGVWDASYDKNASVTALLKGVPAKTRHDRDLGELLSCLWEHSSEGANTLGGRKGDGRTFTCIAAMEDDKYAGAVGPKLMPYGVSEFTLTVLKSEDNSGTGMLLGVAEDVGGAAPHGKWGRVWGVGPWNGRLFAFSLACARTADRSGEIRGDNVLGGADLRGRASGAAVNVRVDTSERRLYFRMGGGSSEWSLARDANGTPIELPATVRPFARAARHGDAIALSNATFTANDASMPAEALREIGASKGRASKEGRASREAMGPAVAPPVRPAVGSGGGASAREAELLAVVESLTRELNDVKLSLARERQLRQQVEREAEVALAQFQNPSQRNSLAERRKSKELAGF